MISALMGRAHREGKVKVILGLLELDNNCLRQTAARLWESQEREKAECGIFLLECRNKHNRAIDKRKDRPIVNHRSVLHQPIDF